MSEPAGVRARIVAVLEGVSDSGPVHDYERYAAREADLRSLYAEENKPLRGWHVRRVAEECYRYGASGRRRVVTRWRLVALHALDDGAKSEIAFDAMLDKAVAVLGADKKLGAAVSHLFAAAGESRTGDPWGPQIEDSGPVMFAGVLCHRAQLSLATTHFEEGTS